MEVCGHQRNRQTDDSHKLPHLIQYFIYIQTHRLVLFPHKKCNLIYLHDELKRENAELKQLLEAKEEEYGKVQAEYRELKLNYTNLKTATTISLNGSDVKETKLRLSKLVREVDKCIALLNE